MSNRYLTNFETPPAPEVTRARPTRSDSLETDVQLAARYTGRVIGRLFIRGLRIAGIVILIGFVIVIVGSVLTRDDPKPSAEETTNAGVVAPVTPTEWQPQDPKEPDFSDGTIVSGSEYIRQFISLNRGVNGFDDQQLAYLGRESWATVQAISSGQGSLFGSNGTNEMGKFVHDWRRLAEVNHNRYRENGPR